MNSKRVFKVIALSILFCCGTVTVITGLTLIALPYAPKHREESTAEQKNLSEDTHNPRADHSSNSATSANPATKGGDTATSNVTLQIKESSISAATPLAK